MARTKLEQESYQVALATLAQMSDEDLLTLYADDKRTAERIAGSLDAIKEVMLGRLMERGVDDVKYEGLGSVRIQQGRTTKTILPQRLLEKGVSGEIIEYATEVRQGDPFAVVTLARNGKEE